MATRGKSQELAKKRIIRERGWQCEWCGYVGYVELHHREQMSDGGDHADANVVLLCDSCHRKIHGIKPRRPGVAVWADS